MFKKGVIIFELTALLGFVLMISACQRDDYRSVPYSVTGYKPVYYLLDGKFEDSVYSTKPRSLVNPGKIYVYQSYLLVNESGKGIHVFDNSDPVNPLPVAFINVPYNFDMAVKDNTLYGDTYLGLVVVDITNLPDITLIKLIKHNQNITYPPLPNANWGGGWSGDGKTYFECIDSEKGVVIDWKEDLLIEPKCYQ